MGQQTLVIEAQKTGGGLTTAMKRKLVNILTAKGTPRTAAMKAVGLVSSSYYYRPVSRQKPRALDAKLVAAISKVRQGRSEVYGYRKVTEALRATSSPTAAVP